MPLPYKVCNFCAQGRAAFAARIFLFFALQFSGRAVAQDPEHDPPPPPPAPGMAAGAQPGNANPAPDENPDVGADPALLRYQDCFQKMIDAGASDNAFMKRCLAVDGTGKSAKIGTEAPLSKDEVIRGLKPAEGELKRCYEKSLSAWKDLGKRPEGELSFTLSVKQGAAIEVVYESGLQDASLAGCFKEHLKGAVFRKSTDQEAEKIGVTFALKALAKGGAVSLIPAKLKLTGKASNLSSDDALSVFRKNAPKIRQCYDDLLKKKPGAGGKVAVTLIVGPKGKVARIGFREFSIEGPGFKNCLINEIKKWKYPKPHSGEPATVDYPAFEFRSM